ncbi:MAG: TRAP transporter small permease subunit [Alphaproteobacteria bacterium]|nr:TRAP transporter small permease subunit [Alphaproteobacteria bacterium]
MKGLFSFAQSLQRISNSIGRFSAWAIVLLALVIITDVVLRRWFVIGSTKLQEMEWHLHGFLFLMCLGWAYSKNAHVRIELVSERLSLRTHAWIELIGCALFLLPYVAAVLWFGFDYVSYSWAYNEASASPTGLPDRWIIKSAIVIGFAMLGFAALARLIYAGIYLFGPKALAEQTPFSHTEPQTGES